MKTTSLYRKVSISKQQRRLQLLRFRYLPYKVILVISCVAAVARLYVLPDWSISAHFLVFLIQFAFLTGIWHLVKGLNNALDKRIPFSQGPVVRIILQIVLTMLIVAPVLIVATYYMLPYMPSFVTSQFIGIGIAIFMIMIFLFNFAFYSYYFFRNWQESVEDKAKLEVQTAELEREKFNLQYHQLKNQVNPHYLFNTLTSLDGLIQTNPPLASEFVRHMSKVYRYVLQHKENEVVSLEEELEFIEHYIELLHIRYGKGLSIHHTLSPAALDKGIVMVTLQLLIDNAIKHNIIQPSAPLKIIIWDEDNYLVIHNNKQLRKQIETSNGQGIKQLKQLYGYLSGEPVIIIDTKEHFTVKIPLL